MYDLVLAPLLLLGLTAAVVVVLRVAWLRDSKARAGDRGVALTFHIAIGHVIIFMLLPAVLRFAFDWHSDRAVHVAPSEVVYVYFIELVSFTCWAFGFVALRSLLPPGGTPSKDPVAGRTEKLFLFLMLGVGALRAAEMLFSRQVLVSGEGVLGATSATSDRFFWPLLPATTLSGTVVACYVLARGRQFFGTAVWGAAVGGLVLYVASFGLSGVRGALMWPAVWSTLVVRLYRPRLTAVTVLALVAFLAFFSAFQDSYLALRDVDRSASTAERLTSLRETNDESQGLGASAEQRLGAASRYSVGFVRMWERGRSAGWKPIANSLWAPLPRLFFPDKPWPTSVDGDQYTSGMYLCVTEVHQSVNFTMTEFLTGAHAFWEFGWVGVIALSLVAGAYAAFGVGFAARLGSAGPPVLLLFFKPWGYNNPKMWISDVVLELTQLVPAVLALWLCAKVIARLTASSVNRDHPLRAVAISNASTAESAVATSTK